jgi:choline kinase
MKGGFFIFRGWVEEIMQKAVILAAGSGRRLAPYTRDLPKPLVEVGGQPILVRLIQQLLLEGMGEFVILVGDRAEQIQDHLTTRFPSVSFRFLYNPLYQTTNNSYSLWLAREELTTGCFLFEGDIVADQQVLHKLLTSESPCCWAVCPFQAEMDGGFLEGEAGAKIRNLTIVSDGVGRKGFKSMGMLKISRPFGERFSLWLDQEESLSRRDRYYDLVLADHLEEDAPELLVIATGRWLEIDTPADLQKAQQLFAEDAPPPL